jgi:uncharacterized protein YjiK
MSTSGPPDATRPEDEGELRRRSDDVPAAPAPLARTPEPGAPPAPDRQTDKGPPVAKLSKKARKLLKDAYRPLDSWERYRALTDVLDEAIDLVDLADHKARFALVILAAVNVAIFFVAGQFDLTKAVPNALRPYLGAYLLIYVLFALYFFLQAIESLRPRKSQPQVPVAETAPEDFPLGVRFYEDILRRDVEEYKRAWREVHIGQLNAELAVQAHALAVINKAKYAALRRLYQGLQIMTLMAVGLVAAAALSAMLAAARGQHQDKAAQRGHKVFGEIERVTGLGVKEPSGVAFDAARKRLFVVGDDGSLAELNASGQRLRTASIENQIEDVAVLPTGSLVLLSEKKSELIVYDPDAQREVKRFAIDVDAVLGEPSQDPTQGFEGLAFRPDPGKPGGGIYYLTHQRAPAVVVALAFDPAAAPARLGAAQVLSRWPMGGFEDLTAAAWLPSLERLAVIADAKDRLLLVKPDGSVEAEFPLPGLQQEGLCFDDAGTMWIADDKDKSLFRVPGALGALQSRMAGGEEPAEPGGPLLKGPKTNLLGN